MMNDNNRFEDARTRAAQEEHRRIRDMNRENERQRKIATRRQIIVGGIVAKYFPDVIKLQPQLSRAKTDAEFAELDKFLSIIASDPKFSDLFQELVGKRTSSETGKSKNL